MNRTTIGLPLFLLLALAVGAPVAATPPTTSYLHFEGALDRGRLPIMIDLLVEGTTVEGSYYRTDQGAWTIVQGTLGRGRMTLIERNGEGQEVARFTARRNPGGVYSGTWRGTPEGAGHPATFDFAARETPGAARLDAVVLKERLFARANRRSSNAPRAEVVYIGPKTAAVADGEPNRAVNELRRALVLFNAGIKKGDTTPIPANTEETWRNSRDDLFRRYREVLAEADELPEYTLQWSEVDRAFVRLNESDLLVIESTHYSFEGGAHGVCGSDYGIFDLRSGARLTYADLFTPAAANRLRPILKRRVLEMLAERIGEPATDDDLFIDGAFPISENIYLRRDGVGFHYNVYEIAPYAVGDFDLVLTWQELRGLLRAGTAAERLSAGN
jgi:hypothetical protein